MPARTPAARDRVRVVNRLWSLHRSADLIRCDEVIENAGLDVLMDSILETIDDVLARLPKVEKMS